MDNLNSFQEDVRTGLDLVIRDLGHDWKLSTCLVLAIAAVVAPLLILFGLKFGTITTLENRLLNDPKNLEIIPRSTLSRSQAWFDNLKKRSEIAFVVPSTRKIAATLNAQVMKGTGRSDTTRLDIVPTAVGDILLLKNEVKIPSKEECVLTRKAAEVMGATKGDLLQCSIGRTSSGNYEKVTFSLRVTSILPEKAGSRNALYASLDLLQAIEAYRDGRAVPRYDWPGKLPLAYPEYHGFVLGFEKKLSLIQEMELQVGTGLSKMEKISPRTMVEQIGYVLPEDLYVYLLQVMHTPVGQESLDALQDKLRGMKYILLPYVRPIHVRLTDAQTGREHSISVQGYWVADDESDRVGLPQLPKVDDLEALRADDLQMIVPAKFPLAAGGSEYTLTVEDDDRELSFPVQITGSSERLQRAMVPAQLAGIMNVFFQRDVSYHPKEKRFLLGRMSFADFRMYASSLDDVITLRQFFHNQGIEVKTMAGEIERIKGLARGLSRIFWLVAVVGTIGCMAALIASFASSVERKRKDLGVMRLMGISGWFIFFIPVAQAIFLGCFGFITATGAYFVIAEIINTVFAQDMMAGEKMCRLGWMHIGIAMAATLCIAMLSALFASKAAVKIDPSEALRDE
jgi:putative ABC transport system permease protein